MATPMIALYNLSIIAAWRVTIKRERKAALQAEIDRARDEAEAAARKERKAKKAAAKKAAALEAAKDAEKQLPAGDDDKKD
jgi:hypothetical protein